MSRIAFINPAASFINSNEPLRSFIETSRFMYFYNQIWSGFSTGLLTLAALTPDEFDVVYIDEKYEDIPFNEDFDIVAITASVSQADRAYEIADRFRSLSSPPVVAMGGVHASFLPDEATKHVDVVFCGEGEHIWPAFLGDYLSGKAKKLYDSAEFPLVDITQNPVPRYDLLNPDNYQMIWIQTSRGCPINCEFCSATKFMGQRHRKKTVEQVVNEIKMARHHLKMKQILFADDNMLVGRMKNPTLLRELREIGISFVAQSDISVGKDPEFLEFLKDCGCSTLFIGFESLNEKNLELMNETNWKRKALDKYSTYVKNISEAGIGVYGAFIVGYDHDTLQTFDDLSDFITGNHLSGAQITILTPLPGTDLRERYRQDKKILDTKWSNYTLFDVNIEHPNMSKEEIEDNLTQLYMTVYSRENLDKKNRYFKQIFRKKFSRGENEQRK